MAGSVLSLSKESHPPMPIPAKQEAEPPLSVRDPRQIAGKADVSAAFGDHSQAATGEPPPPFLAFTPAPVRARRDGWTPDRQRRFILHLARGCGVDEAARLVGRSRQTAYALRARARAEGFAGAWDAAIDFAAQVRAGAAAGANLPGGFAGMGDQVLVPRFYRGRLVGYVMR